MKRGRFLVGVILLLAGGQGVLSFTQGAIALKPGVERWAIKTSVPEGATLDHPRSVSYADLAKLPALPGVSKNDKRYQKARVPVFPNFLNVKEGDILTVQAWLHLVAAESDGDYHLQVSGDPKSQASCLVVEVPSADPRFAVATPLRSYVQRVREFVKQQVLMGKAPSARGSRVTPPLAVEVTGQLFYDDAHVGDKPRGKRGCRAATLWELHPVTAIRAVR